jgi:hypothetical protein
MNVFYPSIFQIHFPLFETQLKGVNLSWRKGGSFIGICERIDAKKMAVN